MNPALETISPQRCATVGASAGTGKTWLLVSRLIRLLLSGARPQGILAVTFTRKAAAEMQLRLNFRLRELAQCNESELDEQLTAIGAPLDEPTRYQARTLYETLLCTPLGIKATTFHAFCQDILQRFPLEAGIPPGFDLLESTAELQRSAWDALCAEASRTPDSDQAKAIEMLFEACGGLENTRTALNNFLNHRSDWWAYTELQEKPLEFATTRLAEQLGISPAENPLEAFFHQGLLQDLEEFSTLLQKHPTKTHEKFIAQLVTARDTEKTLSTRFHAANGAFFTQKGEPLARRETKAQAKAMGENGQQRFLELHHRVCQAIGVTRAALNAQAALQRTTAWYQAGINLLGHYQRLKTEQRLLDFADLEWQAYRLLNHGENVHWIQYKLDQRIDHLLIDEFQDTNPTQWRLILPLLQELAAGEDARGRTVFLVGDNKQSIYRFRRADPDLFIAARQWLKKELRSIEQPLDTSWRSAPALIRFVNQLFGQNPLNQQIVDFSTHHTHHQNVYGQVELSPLSEAADTPDQPATPGLRNPLLIPRSAQRDERHLHEGRLIAQQINTLIAQQTPITDQNHTRRLRYSDILILMRHRTNAASYEQAMREAGIPYNSANRGTLLDSQEARDLVDLLQFLTAPFDNVALAGLLRSPLFSCSNEELMTLAKTAGNHWIDRLQTYTEQLSAEDRLGRAHRLLSAWRTLVDTRPVHDLLDRIYAQGDVFNRYRAAYPRHLQHRAEANLTRFIELALEVDSGRYPTLGHFVARLQALRQHEQDAPDEGTATQLEARVNIMTIHGAKGLEAPVVFLVDSTNTHQGSKAYHAVVDWPATAKRPECFLLAGKKDNLDEFTRGRLEQQAASEQRENANLLYVAVTRARQYLFISGCRPARGDQLGWYGYARAALQGLSPAGEEPLRLSTGTPPALDEEAVITRPEYPPPDPRLQQPLKTTETLQSIAPSQAVGTPDSLAALGTTGDSDQQTRGMAIHRCLELLCSGIGKDAVLSRLTTEYGLASDTSELQGWYEEAAAVYTHPEFATLFDPATYRQAFNEVPIHFRSKVSTTAVDRAHQVYGIIDRVVITDDEVLVLDYKTQVTQERSELRRALIEHHREQLAYYCEGAALLWPGKKVRGAILFTHSRTIHYM